MPKRKNLGSKTRRVLRSEFRARLKKRGVSPGIRRRQALRRWTETRASFFEAFRNNRERINAIKAFHPKLAELLSNAQGIKVSPDKGSPAIIVSFSSRKGKPEDAVSRQFVELAKKEGLEHIVGSEVSGRAVKTVFEFGGKKQPVVLMLIDEERAEANADTRRAQIEKMRGLIDSWASRELTVEERRMGVSRTMPKYAMSRYRASAAEQIASELRAMVKGMKKGELTEEHINHLRHQLNTHIKEWIETEQFKLQDPKKFGEELRAEVHKAIDTVRAGLIELHPRQVVRAAESARNLRELRRNIIERRRFIRQINRTGLSEKEIEDLFRKRRK